MDPAASLQMAREAMDAGEYEEAALHYQNLDTWVTSGGYLPLDWMRCAL